MAKDIKDHVKDFGGVFTLERAEKLFPGKGLQVMEAIAEAGGYGKFTVAEFKYHTLAAPAGEDKKEQAEKINNKLNSLK